MGYTIKELPEMERPRERLLHYGADHLSTTELLAILLKTGTKDHGVNYVAQEVLSKAGSIKGMKEMSLANFCQVKGIGKTKAIELLAALELGKRLYLEPQQESKVRLTKPEEFFSQTKYLFQGKQQEYFYCFYFNTKQELIERKLLFMGTINRSVVHPREIFKEAYLLSASSIVCMHNHPSGDIYPSREDIRFTRSLVEIGKLQGIPVLDHIIVSDTAYYSFYEDNQLCV